MYSSRLYVFAIEYSKLYWDDDCEGIYSSFESIDTSKEYFDDECKFNSRLTDLYDDSDIKVVATFSGELLKIN